MMSPHHLHATTAAWSLQAARHRLAELVDAERAMNGQQLLSAAPIRSGTYGTRHATGGHADPTSSGIGATTVIRDTQWTDLAWDITTRLTGPAAHLPGTGDPLGRILAAIPRMLPGTAAVTTTLLVRLDERVRRELRLSPDRELLPGVPCPACGRRLLYAQTAGPRDAWTVVCGAGCICSGTGCPCGMPGAVEGARHIWPRAVVVGAVAGADPVSVMRPNVRIRSAS